MGCFTIRSYIDFFFKALILKIPHGNESTIDHQRLVTFIWKWTDIYIFVQQAQILTSHRSLSFIRARGSAKESEDAIIERSPMLHVQNAKHNHVVFMLPLLLADGGFDGNPHISGLSGQRLDVSGIDRGWYCMLRDEIIGLQVNVRFTASLPIEFSHGQLMMTVVILSNGQCLVLEVRDSSIRPRASVQMTLHHAYSMVALN